MKFYLLNFINHYVLAEIPVIDWFYLTGFIKKIQPWVWAANPNLGSWAASYFVLSNFSKLIILIWVHILWHFILSISTEYVLIWKVSNILF